MADHPLITVTHLNWHNANRFAISDMNFVLNRGEALGFLGPNGAGKSSTLRMVTGNLAPHSGQILVNGIDLLEHPIEAKRHIGYLPENPPLYPELTVNEYLHFCARIHLIKKPHIQQAVEQAIERCDLGTVRKRVIGKLSKGYQQRVGIAQAIIHEPAIIILDEPTVGLDPIQNQHIKQLLTTLKETHAIILSTHILAEVVAICSHVQIIQQGKLIYKDKIDQPHNTHKLRLLTNHNIELEKIKMIDGVKHIAPTANGEYIIDCDSHNDPSEHIAALVVTQKWGLKTLAPITLPLEQVFIDLIRKAS